MDEIEQRRADMAVLKNIRYKSKSMMGKHCVRIMKKDCYSFEPNNVKEKYDWCQIDPKYY
jgi:hypothetical protein